MQLVDRVLRALEILSRHMDGMSISELSESLGIPPSSTHRVLASLRDNHFVIQDEETKKYRLGYKICGIAAGVARGDALLLESKMPMKRLSEEIDRNVVLCIMEQDSIVNIACSERNDSNMYMMKTGRRLPLYSTSAGRLFAAYMDREQALELLEHENRTQTTLYTKTEIKDLNMELDRIRKSGYALIDEELQLGIQGVACPVFDMNGEPAAALAFTTQKDGDEAGLESRINRLKQYAEEISKAIR